MNKLILNKNNYKIKKFNYIDNLHQKIHKFIFENKIKQMFICDNFDINKDYFKHLNLESINFNNTNKIFFGVNKTIFKTIIKIPLKSWIFINDSISENDIKLLNMIKVKGIIINSNVKNKYLNNNNNIIYFNNKNLDNNFNNIIKTKRPLYNLHPLYRSKFTPKVKVTRLEKKEQWREFCKNNFKYLELFKDNIKKTKSKDIAMVFIEFRSLPTNNFVILNNLIKLGDIKCYIVCGSNDNSFNYFKDYKNVKIVKLNVDNVDVDYYNNLLLSKDFWNNFNEEHLLICQEDSIIFNSKFKLIDFIYYDYIGAPWPKTQKENINNVGNGGFSFRKKSKMLEVLQLENKEQYLNLSENVIAYMEKAKLSEPPEDIFFSNILINSGKGFVADYLDAGKFSTELVKLSDSFGGHNWWLSQNLDEHCFEEDFTRIFNCVGMYSPFKFSLGGGEKYFSYIIKSFIKLNYIVIIFNNTEEKIILETLNNFLDNHEIKFIKILKPEYLKKNLKLKYYFEMANLSYPEQKGKYETNILHTQFPMNYEDEFKSPRFELLKDYKYFILNSEFTKKYFLESIPKEIRNKYNIEEKVKILYPPCDFPIIEKPKKVKNRFLLIGRIFKYDKFANNKYHSNMITIFNNIKKPFELFLVGTCDDMIYLRFLKSKIKNKNIKIEHNISNERKIELLKTSEYIISATGMKDKRKCNQEHFGISLIEGINYYCKPLSFNGGFPSIFLSNDYLFNNDSDLFKKVNNIIDNKLILNEINKDITNKFTSEKFIENYINIINNE